MHQDKSYNKNHLIWIAIGVFICLICLTIVSLLDLKKDYQKNPMVDNQATMTAGGQSYYSGVGTVAVCPNCRATGIPKCFYCGFSMKWNPSTGIYFCPRCLRVDPALCPRCGTSMQPLRKFRVTPIDPRGNFPPPVQNATPIAGCATCPSRSYCQPAAGQGQQVAMPCPLHCPGCPLASPQIPSQQVAMPCPGACPGCPLGTPQTPNQQIAWPNRGIPSSPVAGFGRPDYLICPNCNYTMPHQFGIPAYTVVCPNCGRRMIRGR